jgi:predicted nucleic acid-binding protein
MIAPTGQTLIVAEPPPRYRLPAPLVVDCSVVSAVLFDEAERRDAAGRIAGHGLFAPTLLDYEVASVAVTKHRCGMTIEQLELALSDYAAADIELLAVDRGGVIAVARAYSLSAYDAAYLWLAAALKAPLATFDRRLGEAAQRHLGALDGDSR